MGDLIRGLVTRWRAWTRPDPMTLRTDWTPHPRHRAAAARHLETIR